MGDKNQSAVKGLKTGDQCLDGLEIEVIGRLVQDQDVWLVNRNTGKKEPRRLPAGKTRNLFLHLVARKQHLAETASHRANGFAGAGGAEPTFDGGVDAGEGLSVILGKITRPDLVSPLRLARICGQLADRDLEQGRLADAVGSDDGQAVSPANVEADVGQYLVFTEGLAEPLDFERFLAAWALLAELKDRIAT